MSHQLKTGRNRMTMCHWGMVQKGVKIIMKLYFSVIFLRIHISRVLDVWFRIAAKTVRICWATWIIQLSQSIMLRRATGNILSWDQGSCDFTGRFKRTEKSALVISPLVSTRSYPVSIFLAIKAFDSSLHEFVPRIKVGEKFWRMLQLGRGQNGWSRMFSCPKTSELMIRRLK